MSVFAGRKSLTCHFCQNVTEYRSSLSPTSWKCLHCQCWNRLESSGSGEILTEEPAMGDWKLNMSSWRKRAVPTPDRLPSEYAPSPFCRECVTNQTLINGMLSNYLPPPEDPTYETLVVNLPVFKADLERRYPPVCADCEPLVEATIRKHDQFAKVSLLQSYTRSRRQQRPASKVELPPSPMEVAVWKLSGIMWIITFVGTLICGYLGLNWPLPDEPSAVSLSLVPFATCTLLWATWEPIWLQVRLERSRSRAVVVVGRETWKAAQYITFTIRLLICLIYTVSSYRPSLMHPSTETWHALLLFGLMTTLVLTLVSAAYLKCDVPVSIALTHRPLPSTPRRATDPNDLLSSLSLSNASPSKIPPSKVANPPSFTSLFGPSSSTTEEMEWEPVYGPGDDKEGWNKEGLIAPRTFPNPNEATGLESLISGWQIQEKDDAKIEVEERNPLPSRSLQSTQAGIIENVPIEWVALVAVECLHAAVRFGGEAPWHILAGRWIWGSLAMLSCFRFGQNKSPSSTIVSALALTRAALPEPLFAQYRLMWDAISWLVVAGLGVIWVVASPLITRVRA